MNLKLEKMLKVFNVCGPIEYICMFKNCIDFPELKIKKKKLA